LLAYLLQVDITDDLDIGGGLWLDNSLIGAHNVAIGVCGLHLKQNELAFAFVHNLNIPHSFAILFQLLEDHGLRREDSHELSPVSA
jgi:hypothetical protein